MNKQEAIEKIKNRGTLNIYDKVAGQQVDMVIKNEVLDIISQIDEPQKVVVPKFVAEWYKRNKDDFESKVYDLCLQFNRDTAEFSSELCELSSELYEWFDCGKNEPIQTLVKMELYGYTVEQEKLYTVEIPDPNSIWKYTFLTNRGPGVSIDRTDGDFWKDDSKNQLTESEIKQDFEWAWQWAEPVEEEEW